MSKKDTILIAVLVNVGVLIVLFLSSIKQQPVVVNPAGQVLSHNHEEKKEAKSLDQVDAVLSNYEKKMQEAQVSKQKSIKEPLASKKEPIAKQEPKQSGAIAKSIPTQQVQTVQSTPNNHHIQEVTIQQGDSLDKIAKIYGCSIEELKQLNHLTSSSYLQIGHTLYVPKHSKATKPVMEQQQQPLYYTVKTGDSPWKIAHKNHIKLEELLRLNGLNEAKAKKLKPGDRLRIR